VGCWFGGTISLCCGWEGEERRGEGIREICLILFCVRISSSDALDPFLLWVEDLQSVPSISKTIPCNAGAPSVAGWPRGAKRRLLGCCEEAILMAANWEIVRTLLGLEGVLQIMFRSLGFSVRLDIAVIWLVKFDVLSMTPGRYPLHAAVTGLRTRQ
jgi:hypothetical protein